MTFAARYTHGHHDSVLRSHRWRTVENSASYLEDVLVPGTEILDVGCGPGTITCEFARLVAPGDVVGVDASFAVITEAREQALAEGIDNVRFEVGDVYDLDFASGRFGLVHAHQLLQHLDRPIDALAEMRRVCADDGIVAARDSDYAAMTWYPDSEHLERWLACYELIARANGGEPDAGRRLRSWAIDAGFAEVVSSASVWTFATPEERAFWGEMWADRVISSAFASQAVERGVASPSDLAGFAEAWRSWAASEAGWFAVLHGEVRCQR